jgi:hypothetical protein
VRVRWPRENTVLTYIEHSDLTVVHSPTIVAAVVIVVRAVAVAFAVVAGRASGVLLTLLTLLTLLMLLVYGVLDTKLVHLRLAGRLILHVPSFFSLVVESKSYGVKQSRSRPQSLLSAVVSQWRYSDVSVTPSLSTAVVLKAFVSIPPAQDMMVVGDGGDGIVVVMMVVMMVVMVVVMMVVIMAGMGW